ncbi:hypothetical protein DBV15_04066 [Temnothorax longispinosus]|nr:hypothetical protein DBV15_04066 [Temnothorax longispinosus]
MTPGPLLPQTSPRKFFLRSRTQASATRRPNFDMSKPMTPAATSSQSSAPAKFVRFSSELVTTTSRSRTPLVYHASKGVSFTYLCGSI